MNYIANFFVGAFFCNCIPHLVCGLMGQRFPTPFAKPAGVGLSSPTTNFLWGFANAVAGTALLIASPIGGGFNAGLCLAGAGALAMGVALSFHFGGVQRRRSA